jgi:hypothetical protein
MNNFYLDEIQRKDLFTALSLWVTVELVSFILFPALGLIQPAGATLRAWFFLSVPFGIGGAILISMTSRFLAVMNDKIQREYRFIYAFLGQFGGWIGLAGVMFPFLMVCIEFFTKMKLPSSTT